MKKKERLQKPPTSKRRKNRQKAKRLAGEAVRAQLGRARKKLRADAPVTAIRRAMQGEIVIGVRKGLFGHPGTVILKIDDASLVGCVEDRAELAKLVNNVGLLVVAQLFRHDLTQGIEGLAKTIVAWAGIDLEALQKAAEEDPERISDFSPAPDSGNERTCPVCEAVGFTPDTIAAHIDAAHTEVIDVPSVDDAHPNETTPIL